MQPNKCDLIIKGSYILTQNEERELIKDGAVAVSGKTISAVGKRADIEKEWLANETIDCGKSVILPGLINSHTHVPMTLMRGVADDLPLLEWLHNYMFPIESGLTKDLVELGARLGCAEMVASGTTAILDGYMYEDVVGKAVDETGMKAVLGEGFFKFPSPFFKTAQDAWDVIEELHNQFANHDRIKTAVTPHAVFTTDPDQLAESMKLAERLDLLWQIHAAESVPETKLTLETFGKRPIEILKEYGLLKQRTRLHHCVDVTDEEIGWIKDAGTMIAHNPQSNLKLGSGICPLTKFIDAGITTGLGTDGAASNNNLDMFDEMRTAAMLQKGFLQDPEAMPAQKILDMATLSGAEFLGFDDCGAIKSGMKADIIAIDMDKMHLKPVYNPLSHVIYSAGGQDVCLTICDGSVLYRDGKFQTADVETISREAEKAVEWALKRLKNR
ncbi:amidohydrolase family protein [Maridesulfovibrio salexigens]|uniref:5-methylthioadenosine/S-adenosylhomocysteine deaminase n=1 Tax=Maridesulfovibrio salexigens (strain ATCC 14822 / DSM 2638 / NCIMB 8403 / VKM B-1763) TaxID=526222 RepID=C6BSV8_MARSD|nr:amidohydrolase [Maridesulfovibrio salexigens]ACS79662.1 amidohydrolase [Maridesulfovibrio salexigens DSM 2638]